MTEAAEQERKERHKSHVLEKCLLALQHTRPVFRRRIAGLGDEFRPRAVEDEYHGVPQTRRTDMTEGK